MSRPSRIALAWTLLVVALCLIPGRWIPESHSGSSALSLPHLDKAVHFLMFGIFGWLWMRTGPSKQRAWRVLGAGVLLAVATELAQGIPFIARDPDVLDALADCAGVAAGVLASLAFARQVHPSSQS